MLLSGRSAAALGEGDPIPPEDRVRDGASHEVEQIYLDHRARLLRFFTRSASAELAHDLCQQLFTRLSGRSSKTVIVDPVAYIHRSARNLIADRNDRERRTPLQVELSSAGDLTAPDQLAALEARDLLRRLEASLSRLPPRTREIFLAHRLDGYSYREISARTGLSVKTIEKHMSRAIAHLDRLSAHL